MIIFVILCRRLYEVNLSHDATRESLIRYTSTLESMELVPNLVFIISALLLRDGSRRHNDHSLHPVVLSVSGEILWVLNAIGRMNLSLVQTLPIELQVRVYVLRSDVTLCSRRCLILLIVSCRRCCQSSTRGRVRVL